MTLNNLIDNKSSADSGSTDDQTDTDKTSDTTTKIKDLDDLDSIYEINTDRCDLDAEEKCCPGCLTPSPKQKRRTYICPNDNCSKVKFTMSFFEWKGWQGWLESIDWCEVFRDNQELDT